MAARDYLMMAKSLSSGSGTPQVQTVGHAPEVMRLAAQLSRQRQQAGIGVQKPDSPGFISKIFDVVQRPLYASANAADYLTQGKNPIEGAVSGAWGTEKSTYDKVLGDMGMSGGWQRSLLGFGLDIGLDPTTYVGAGLIKNTAEGVARKAAAEAVMAAAGEELAPTAIIRRSNELYDLAKSAKNSLQGAGEEAASKIVDPAENVLTEAVTKNTTNKMAAEEFRGNILDKYWETYDKEIAKGRGKVVLKVLGKEIGIGSEGLYSAGQKLGEVANKSSVVRGIAKDFRPTSIFRQGTNSLLRTAQGHSLYDSDIALSNLRGMLGDKVTQAVKDGVTHKWGGLTEFDRQTISHALEDGTNLSNHLVESTGRSLQEYKKVAEDLLHAQADTELEMGILKPGQKMPGYAPHIYNGGTPEEQAAFAKGRKDALMKWSRATDTAAKDGKPPPVLDMSKWSLKKADEAGLKPETDILKSMGHRTVDSYRNQSMFRFYDAVAKEFGVSMPEELPGGLTKSSVKPLTEGMGLKRLDHKYFGGTIDGVKGPGHYYFHPEVHDALTSAMKQFEPGSGSELLKLFDKVQNTWKLGMTAVNPGHHIRNFLGDVFLNTEDNVWNPLQYERSMNTLKNYKANPNMPIFKMGDTTITAGDLMNHYGRYGGKAGFFRVEGASLGERGLTGIHPIERIRQFAETREDWTRLAHFIDVMEKEGKNVKSIEDIQNVAKTAGQRVRKFNIDYGDLTPFERKFMKRTVPFYTWMRKNIPLQVETLAMDPGKISVIPKGLRALQQIAGGNLSDDQIYGLNTVPQWLRDMAGVRVFGEGMGRNQVYWNPSVFPAMDLGQYFTGGPKGIASAFMGATSPLIRTPIEQVTGRKIGTGAPITESGPEYYGGQILPPSVPALWDIIHGKGEKTDVAKLLGISAYNVGPQQQLGELRRQQDTVQAILKAKRKHPPRSWETQGG